MHLLLIVLLPGLALSSECEVCDLQEQLSATNQALESCQNQLKDNSGTIGQVCSTVGSWFSKDTSLKRTVHKLLEKMDVLTQPDPSFGIERELTISLSPEDIKYLKQFVLIDEGHAENVEKILDESLIVRETILDKTSDFISTTFLETSMHFKANYVIIFQILVLLSCVVLPLALGAPKVPVFLFMCLYAVFTTWVKLYYVAAAKKQAVLAKLSHVPTTCHIEKQGWLAAVRDFATGLFNGQHDPCEDYYTAAMVDPALEVGLVTALMETFSSCLVIPAQTLGQALGQYYLNILEPLPLMWKLPVLILATLLLLFILLVSCGYEFSIPFLCRVGPDSHRTKDKSNSNAVNGVYQFEEIQSKKPIKDSGGWRHSIMYKSHPSEEYDSTDNKCLPYPTEKNEIDKIVDGT